ncbi:oxoprolinase family protein [Rhodopirellula sallentina]|uniref:5-oxoprolinase (ATP-hydrolyzing) n=1 Tax=Rhodopirellula sallentina SM41 TaxID=1263870 RepID=M5UIW2_9BACT|nr:oxoprolinase family protein [Rhodopirellula sallentina]EMI55973.1 5-oxoprolinase (ATP-hydrolyzing) [Rhodopirellula sallentina SM41]
MFEVWADIGGTFTDCLVTRRESGSPPRQETLKVLSSGLVTVDLLSVASSRELLVRMPRSLVEDDFWIGAKLVDSERVDRGVVVQCEIEHPHDEVTGGESPVDEVTVDEVIVDEVIGDVHVQLTLDRDHGVTTEGQPSSLRLTLDAGLEAPVLATRLLLSRLFGERVGVRNPLPHLQVRLGTTRGTNALLTRGGASTALFITEGLGDLLSIGTQDRPDLFSLDIVKPEPLPNRTIEVHGRMNALGEVIHPIDKESLRREMRELYESDDRPEVIAICLMHSYLNDAHERIVERIARDVGFERVVRSTQVVALPRIVPRAETTTLDAYLQPVLEDYVARVNQQFGGPERCLLRWMTSGGNLVASEAFRGRESVLSGPAGGVVALAEIARKLQSDGVQVDGAVGLDMGGTSTDVSRFDGEIGRRQESQIGGIRILSPMMDIHTVAAGGGSICGVRDGRLFVGPESAGADPGPACYGRGGPLTITDLNVVLGRLPIERFPFRLDPDASWQRLEAIRRELPVEIATSAKQLAEGFLRIAVTEMAEAVRVVTTAAGNDVRKMALVGFGGAAGGHLCRVAESLGISHVIDHPQSGILSAVGIGHAPVGRIVTRAMQETIAAGVSPRSTSADVLAAIREVSTELRAECLETLSEEESLLKKDSSGGGPSSQHGGNVEVSIRADVRYIGTQSTLELPLEPAESLAERMDAKHASTFGYDRPNMAIEVVAIRCEATVRQTHGNGAAMAGDRSRPNGDSAETQGSREEVSVPVLDREQFIGGETFDGPTIVASAHSILNVEAGWTAAVQADGTIHMHAVAASPENASGSSLQPETETREGQHADDAIEMEIVARRVQGIAEAMGEVIRRTSVSVNVKERRDYSCAVFLGDGSLVANAPHVPVHLGAMGHTVRSIIASFPRMQPGDCFISNDPFSGGSHLPDVTVVTPVFCQDTASDDATWRPESWPCDYFVASRCHHAEIGGMVPGSMAPEATCLADEGILIRNMPLTQAGVSHHDSLRELLASGRYPSRSVEENMSDIAAAEAAGREGAGAMRTLSESLPPRRLASLLQRLMRVAGEATASWIDSLGDTERHFADCLDDGTPLAVTLRPDPTARRLEIDFSGTGGVHPNGFNATRSIVTAAVLYVLRCVTPNELPLCDGVLRRIDLKIPSGLLDPPGHEDPRRCPAVVAGNVETSNRVVDVLLGALGAAAASQGTMNNLLLGDDTFGYYETIGGGAGATASARGADAVHTHMTNTRITDPEVLETRLPVRLLRFAVRRGSGGSGRHRGGDGMLRELEFLKPLTLSLMTSRRTTSPYGMQGGEPGQPGRQTWIRGNQETVLPACTTLSIEADDRLRIETPGGGGFGD